MNIGFQSNHVCSVIFVMSNNRGIVKYSESYLIYHLFVCNICLLSITDWWERDIWQTLLYNVGLDDLLYYVISIGYDFFIDRHFAIIILSFISKAVRLYLIYSDRISIFETWNELKLIWKTAESLLVAHYRNQRIREFEQRHVSCVYVLS